MKRLGIYLCAAACALLTGTPGPAANYWEWSLPSGLAIDMAKLPTAFATVGSGWWGEGQTSNASHGLNIFVRSETGVSGAGIEAASYFLDEASPNNWGADDYIYPLHGSDRRLERHALRAQGPSASTVR